MTSRWSASPRDRRVALCMYSVTSSTACTMQAREPSAASDGRVGHGPEALLEATAGTGGSGMSYFCTDMASRVRWRRTRVNEALRLRVPLRWRGRRGCRGRRRRCRSAHHGAAFGEGGGQVGVAGGDDDEVGVEDEILLGQRLEEEAEVRRVAHQRRSHRSGLADDWPHGGQSLTLAARHVLSLSPNPLPSAFPGATPGSSGLARLLGTGPCLSPCAVPWWAHPGLGAPPGGSW